MRRCIGGSIQKMFAAKTVSFFNSSARFALFHPTSLTLDPSSCLSPPSSSSSYSFLSSAARKKRELTALTSFVARTICSRIKKKRTLFDITAVGKNTFYSIQGDLEMHLFNKVKDRQVILEKRKNSSLVQS